MTKKRKIVNGISFAEDVNVDAVFDGDDTAEAKEFERELTKPAKIRITTMVDLDIYKALKNAALREGDGRYQTFLNSLLRRVLFNGTAERTLDAHTVKAMIDKAIEDHLQEILTKLQRKITKQKSAPAKPRRRV